MNIRPDNIDECFGESAISGLRAENFHALFNSMAECVGIHQIIRDANGKAVDYIIREVNPSFEKNLNIPAIKARGSLASELYGKRPPADIDIYGNVVDTGEPYYFITYLEQPDRYFEVSAFLLREGWFATVFLDITGTRRAMEELRQTSNKYRRLHESMSDGFAMVDMAGNVKEFNACFRDMLGYSDAELLQLSFLDITPGPWHEYQKRIIRNQVIPHGFSGVFEKEYQRKDGSVFPVELRISLIKDGSGKPEGMWAVVRDITDRKKSEQELEWMVDRFNLATRSGNMGVWEWLIKNDQLQWDDRMFDLFGVERENFSGNLSAWELVLHPEDLDRFRNEISLALKGTKEYDTEFRVVHPNGEIHYIKAFAQVVRDSSGNPLRLTGINFDITLQQKTKESLQISEMFNRGLVESSPVGIVFLDKAGTVTYVNPAMAQAVGSAGSDPAKIIQKSFRDLNIIKAELTSEEIEGIISGKKINALKLHHELAGGKHVDLEIYSAPVEVRSGEVYGIILMAVDVAESIAAEKKLRESEYKYRMLYECMRDGFVKMDMRCHILDYNSFFLSMTGCSNNDLMESLSVKDFIPPVWHATLDRIITEEILRQGYSGVFEVEFKRNDSSVFPVELRLFLNKDQQGQSDGMWVIIREITERKKMETELKEMNIILEKKVEQKTRELQERVTELERFYKATIDRELRMKEMRTRIEELESELNKKNK